MSAELLFLAHILWFSFTAVIFLITSRAVRHVVGIGGRCTADWVQAQCKIPGVASLAAPLVSLGPNVCVFCKRFFDFIAPIHLNLPLLFAPPPPSQRLLLQLADFGEGSMGPDIHPYPEGAESALMVSLADTNSFTALNSISCTSFIAF